MSLPASTDMTVLKKKVLLNTTGRVTRSAKIQVVSQFQDGLEMNKFTCFLKILILPLDRVSSWKGWQCALPRMRPYRKYRKRVYCLPGSMFLQNKKMSHFEIDILSDYWTTPKKLHPDCRPGHGGHLPCHCYPPDTCITH